MPSSKKESENGLVAKRGEKGLTVALKLAFSFTIFDEVCIRFMKVRSLRTALESNTVLSESIQLNLCSFDPCNNSFLCDSEGVTRSSWLSYTFALAVYSRLFLCKV